MPSESPPPRSPEAPCQTQVYGPRPGVHPAISGLARRIDQILRTLPEQDVPQAVRDALAPVLEQSDLLSAEQCQPGERSYRRHVLYGDPDGRFTILALVWMPGQTTPVHGHSAWGAVGVYEGSPNVAIYACDEQGGQRVAKVVRDIRCKSGDVSCVASGYGDVHRIYNASQARVLTIHAYGRDLIQEPESINLVVSR